MKILLFSEGKNLFNKSAVGKALEFEKSFEFSESDIKIYVQKLKNIYGELYEKK
ncbi:hypothetical protein [Marinitoga litoralis]|uniref:hypothetical protein n=1 Tax=Marinitoga litoralis TaxID=570855 RepID=UPI0019603AFA|nr:hypothetical protein [Marinitoga litoralis]MBM7558302.1 hypothetical protein [Marinitoga litoralis]